MLTRRSRKIGIASLAVATVLVASACGDSKTDDSKSGSTGSSGTTAKKGGTLIDGAQLYSDNLVSYDPGMVQTLDESQVTTALFDGLTDFDFTDKKNPVLKGNAAASYAANDDATEWTFTLKKDLKFSNGDPVLPSSFKFAWERGGGKEFASPYGYLINYVKDGSKLQDGSLSTLDAIMADDAAGTLKVKMESPNADFAAIVSHTFFSPVPEKVVKADGAEKSPWDKGHMLIGNGPFKLESMQNEQQVVLVPNDKWAGNVVGDTKPNLDKIIFKISKDPKTAFIDFASGNLDTVTIPEGKFTEAESTYGTTVKSPNIGSYYFDFGTTDPMTSGEKNVKLRQAISMAIDRESINKKVFEGTRLTTTGITPPGIPGFKEGICKYCKYDMEAAKAAFDEWKAAGGTLTGPIKINFNTGSGIHEAVVAIIQQNLKELGIDTVTDAVSEKYFPTMAKGGCNFCRSGWYADYPTYGNFMVDLFGKAAIGGNNMGSYDDPTFNGLLDKAQAETDAAKRGELYNQAEDYLLNTSVEAVPINWYTGDQAYNKDKVANYDQTPLGLVLWERVSLK